MDRRTAAAKSYGCCWYCGENDWSESQYPTTDHVTPRFRGGSDAPSNLVRACNGCNSEKGGRTLEEYRRAIQAEILGMWLKFGISWPSIPLVVFFGETLDHSHIQQQFCRGPHTPLDYEREREKFLATEDDPVEVRVWKRNQRRKLRKRYKRLTSPNPLTQEIQNALRNDYRRSRVSGVQL